MIIYVAYSTPIIVGINKYNTFITAIVQSVVLYYKLIKTISPFFLRNSTPLVFNKNDLVFCYKNAFLLPSFRSMPRIKIHDEESDAKIVKNPRER